MTTITATEIRQQVLEFAATYPTPNVRRAVELAQSGRITWEQVYNLCCKALTAGIEATA